MCIIVAKNAGIAMPDMDTLENCFVNNPDGAGFMLASKGKVYGFKGLMSFVEFRDELDKAKKKFGCLDKLPVVMHFRISTHGSVIGGNTHPFPLKGGYREMRHSEWIADQGFAHNGIILETSKDDDVKKFNVSDTMVFAKKYINPIAKYCSIANDNEIMNMLHAVADSKLCFLDKKGKIATRGDFIESEGVLYSNSSYKNYRKEYAYPYSYNGWDYDGWGEYSYYKNKSCKLKSYYEKEYILEYARGLGVKPLPHGTQVIFQDEQYGTVQLTCDEIDVFIDESDGTLYEYMEDDDEFVILSTADEYLEIIYPEEDENDEKPF